MRRKRIAGRILVVAIIALLNSSFASQKYTIYHTTQGSPGLILLTVSQSALQAHAKHGDIYATSLCPVDGPEYGCR